ncbi:malectin domain-containing carbohydrate-binding protein [Pareuzebyella sediminis]|uniref:malectin domain-containing carbohydrate-binding protein n=1 Tax=Pareuzebyella sediminis TaxID=2607998 RepID=UPI0011EFE665|nr:malectin domain-containing carbohydrate-binding protein [Pareuzebyella sediminis]
MKHNLIIRFFLIPLLLLSIVAVPVACSSSDDSPEPTPQQPEEPEEPEEPDPVADPTNANTTIEATTPENTNGTSTSTVTVQLAEADGTLMTVSGGTVALDITGDTASISSVTDNGDGTYTATVTSDTEETITVSGTLDGTDISDTAVITLNPDDSNPSQEIEQSTEPVGPSILRINSGGPEVTYGDVTFLADQYFTDNTEAYTNPFVTEIDGTDMDELFLTERVTENDVDVRGPFSYDIPVSNGTYTVKLYFAEIYWGVENPQGLEGGVGSRIFNISMEGTPIFTAYDLYKEVGAATASFRMYDVEVTDGELNISIEASVNKPKISAIEIFGNGTIGS